MVEFTTLASSSEGCAYLLSGGGASAPLLIECGLPFKALQKALDYKASSLAGCLISHSHQDHCKAVKGLSDAGIYCYASQETWQLIADKMKVNKHRCVEVYRWPIDFGYNTAEDWTFIAFEAVHDCEGTLGFIIQSPNKDRVLYLTDSCYTKYRFEGLTRICVECNHSMEIMKANTLAGTIDKSRYSRTAHTHMSLERLIEMLKANDLSKCERITLLHLSDANSDERAFKDAIERATGVPTDIAAKGRR